MKIEWPIPGLIQEFPIEGTDYIVIVRKVPPTDRDVPFEYDEMLVVDSVTSTDGEWEYLVSVLHKKEWNGGE